jgi:hypothetical protein
MVASDKVADVVYFALNGDPEVVRLGVGLKFGEAPRLIKVGAKELSEFDNVEDDDAVNRNKPRSAQGNTKGRGKKED